MGDDDNAARRDAGAREPARGFEAGPVHPSPVSIGYGGGSAGLPSGPEPPRGARDHVAYPGAGARRGGLRRLPRMKVHVLHENPDWYAPLGAAFDAAGVPHEQWLLGEACWT